MAELLAVTGAITSATRLVKALEKRGCIKARVVHTPAEISKGGCSYSVKLPESCNAILVTVSGKFRIKGIYRERTENGETVYDDIS